MLERWMPYADAAYNPVFRFGVRRLRFAHSAQTLNRRSLVLIGIGAAVVLALWSLTLVRIYSLNYCATSEPYFCYYPLINGSTEFVAALALFSVAVDVFLDFGCILAGYHTVRLNAEAVHWDLLRLMPMQLDALMQAHYAVAQARAWLMTVLVTTLRVAAVGVFLFTTFIMPLILRGNVGDIGSGVDYSWLFVVTAFGLVGLIFMIEPLWRMRAVTALALALATRFRTPMVGVAAGMGAIMALWLAQGVIFGFMVWLTVLLFRGSLDFAMLFGAALGAVVIWGFYRILTTRSLGRAIYEAALR